MRVASPRWRHSRVHGRFVAVRRGLARVHGGLSSALTGLSQRRGEFLGRTMEFTPAEADFPTCERTLSRACPRFTSSRPRFARWAPSFTRCGTTWPREETLITPSRRVHMYVMEECTCARCPEPPADRFRTFFFQSCRGAFRTPRHAGHSTRQEVHSATRGVNPLGHRVRAQHTLVTWPCILVNPLCISASWRCTSAMSGPASGAAAGRPPRGPSGRSAPARVATRGGIRAASPRTASRRPWTSPHRQRHLSERKEQVGP